MKLVSDVIIFWLSFIFGSRCQEYLWDGYFTDIGPQLWQWGRSKPRHSRCLRSCRTHCSLVLEGSYSA